MRTLHCSAYDSQSASDHSAQLRGRAFSASSAASPVGWRSRKIPSSLIMKKCVAWALSALLPVRASTLRNGVPSSSVPSFFVSGPSCAVLPTIPVMQVTRMASSTGVSGAGSFWLWWVSGPASTENPRGIRRVRRSVNADISG